MGYEYNINGWVNIVSIFYLLCGLLKVLFRELTVFLTAVFSCSEGATGTDGADRLSGPRRVSRWSCRTRTYPCIRIPCDCRTIASRLRWHLPRSWSATKSGINITRRLDARGTHSQTIHYARENRKARSRETRR